MIKQAILIHGPKSINKLHAETNRQINHSSTINNPKTCLLKHQNFIHSTLNNVNLASLFYKSKLQTMKALSTIYRHEVCNGNSSNLQAILSEKKNNMCGVLPIMKFTLLFTIAFMFHVSLAQEGEVASLSQNNLQTNIVYVHKPEGLHSMQSESLHRWYQSLLPVTTASTEHQQQRLLYSYRHVVTGFAARLTAEEVKAMEKKEEVLSIHNETNFFFANNS